MVKADPKHTIVLLTRRSARSGKKKVDGAIAEWAKTRPGVEPVIDQYRKLLAEVKAGSDQDAALFVGHGAPMNAIEDNAFSRKWRELGQTLPRPQSILCISGHWVEHGVAIMASDRPETVHDFYGFPPEYYRLRYASPGDRALAHRAAELLAVPVRFDAARELDHGTWSVLMQMYPEADIPVVQLGLDADRPLAEHHEIATRLAPLRDEGVMVMGSGNIVHNLSMFRSAATRRPTGRSASTSACANGSLPATSRRSPIPDGSAATRSSRCRRRSTTCRCSMRWRCGVTTTRSRSSTRR